MDKYKEFIFQFIRDIEKLNMDLDYDSLTDEEIYLNIIISACTRKLSEVYNKIGDENYVMPDMEFGWL